MAFNPISIDDERVDFPTPQHTADAPTASSLHASGSGAIAADAVDDPLLLNRKTPLRAAPRHCLQKFFFDFSWKIDFPSEPKTFLLYYPQVYKDLLENPAATEIMSSEFDAMSAGVLQRIPLAYYPLQPHVIHDMQHIAEQTDRRIAALEAEAGSKGGGGALDRTTYLSADVNPLLEAADAELLSDDLDHNRLLQRDLPSLTLLQRPLYTDMGTLSQEQRHAARLARIVPAELRALTQGAASAAGLPGSPMSPTSPQLPAGAVASAPAGSAFDTPAAREARAQEWQRDVHTSFRHARAMDGQFDAFLSEMLRGKLGLDAQRAEHRALGRELWRTLFVHTTAAQQRDVWHALCRFSSSYGDEVVGGGAGGEGGESRTDGGRLPEDRRLRRGGGTGEVARGDSAMGAEASLIASLSTLSLPRFEPVWLPLLRRYGAAVAEYAASLPQGASERKLGLHFSGVELDSRYAGAFHPDLVVGKSIQRSGQELGENRVPIPVYPVEVMPVFPSGFTAAARMGPTVEQSEEGSLDFLAEAAESVRHVVLPGALLGTSAALPHVLINDTNLLVADAGVAVSAAGRKEPGKLCSGVTMSYHANKENTFERLLVDETNTSSYVMRVMRSKGDADLAGLPGHPHHSTGTTTGEDVCYCVYDRIGVRSDFVKASHVRCPPESRYVLLFEDEEEEQEGAGSTTAAEQVSLQDAHVGHKRVRKEEDEDDDVERAGHGHDRDTGGALTDEMPPRAQEQHVGAVEEAVATM